MGHKHIMQHCHLSAPYLWPLSLPSLNRFCYLSCNIRYLILRCLYEFYNIVVLIIYNFAINILKGGVIFSSSFLLSVKSFLVLNK